MKKWVHPKKTRMHGTFSSPRGPLPFLPRHLLIPPRSRDLSGSSHVSRHTPPPVPSIPLPPPLPLLPHRYHNTMQGIMTYFLNSSLDTGLASAPKILEMTPIINIFQGA